MAAPGQGTVSVAEALLRGAGLRATRKRIALARLLFAKGNRHISVEELYAEATAANVAVSLATVYNTLNQFQQAGLVRQITINPHRSYFDTNTSAHHHFYVENDGVVMDVANPAFEIATMPRPPAGFVVSGVDIVVRLRRAAG